jgi:hypothetical protein
LTVGNEFGGTFYLWPKTSLEIELYSIALEMGASSSKAASQNSAGFIVLFSDKHSANLN